MDRIRIDRRDPRHRARARAARQAAAHGTDGHPAPITAPAPARNGPAGYGPAGNGDDGIDGLLTRIDAVLDGSLPSAA